AVKPRPVALVYHTCPVNATKFLFCCVIERRHRPFPTGAALELDRGLEKTLVRPRIAALRGDFHFLTPFARADIIPRDFERNKVCEEKWRNKSAVLATARTACSCGIWIPCISLPR